MKKWMIGLSIFFGLAISSSAQVELSPYMGVYTSGNMAEVSKKVEAALQEGNFDVIGKYNVAGHKNLKVICFTRADLKKTSSFFEDRGALASVLKIGIREDAGKIEVSLANPVYMFYAYFGDDYKDQTPALKKIDKDAKDVLVNTFGSLIDFGGKLEVEDLKGYHYKVMMPYFDDPEVLEEYDSFEKGLAFIRKKIAASEKDIQSVYEVVIPEKQMAVFGIGMLNAEIGEGVYLPIIGERHIAAMPYEIILQGTEVSMLHGKYRLALYWPELTMGEFMKIMSTPGDIEDILESITED